MKYVMFFFILLISSDINSQDATHNWSLKNCIDYAAEHNIQLQSLKLNEKAAKFTLNAAEAEKIPSLSAIVNNTFYNAKNTVNGNSLINQLSSIGNYSISSSIIIWNNHLIDNNIQFSYLTLEDNKWIIKKMLNNLTLIIAKEYFDILLSKENFLYISDLVNTSQERFSQGQSLFNEGIIAKKDLLQLQAQLASDNFLLVQSKNSIRQNILILQQTLQLPIDSQFEIENPKIEIKENTLPLLHNVQQYSLSNFPEIKSAELEIDIAKLNILKAASGFKPVISATATFGTGYTSIVTNNYNNIKTNYFKQTENNFFQRMGININIPIFSNRYNIVNLEKNKLLLQQANLALINSQLVLSQEVEQSYINTLNAISAFEYASNQLEASIESYRVVNEAFKIGEINTYDLYAQRNQYVQAIQSYTQSKYLKILNQKVFEFYMGVPITF